MSTPQTLAQKLIAQAAGMPAVREGEIVNCRVDLAMFHDSSGPRRLKPMLEELGARIWDPSRVVLVMDHFVPEADDDARRIVRIARDWAAEQGLPHVHDSQGICHVVLPQKGHLRPGLFCVGGDSHSPTGGAFGSYMFGIGSTEMLGVVVTGEIWVKVPRTLRMRWQGRLADGVCAKDMMLHMIGRLGMNGGDYQAVEFAGDTVRGLSMAERMTLSNLSAELGAQAGLVAPDATTAAWLREVGVTVSDEELARWQTDEGAACIDHDFDATGLVPMVALPHSPQNGRTVDAVADEPVQLAYIGACTGAKLEDLQAAARVLAGR
ncbi:aconitase family protein, partial [Pseudacidovorax intermedius]|uniref:aconitase family protein n=1 Tax=Pseudacidovorax intermedius TaxID=433924 RepID=UPI0005C2964E